MLFRSDREYWVGVYAENPSRVWFVTDQFEIDPAHWTRLDSGEVIRFPWVPGKQRWRRPLELREPSTAFFELGREEQLEVIVEFVRASLAMATHARSTE